MLVKGLQENMTRDREVNYEEFTNEIMEMRSPGVCNQKPRKTIGIISSNRRSWAQREWAGEASILKVALLEAQEESMSC